MNCPICAHKAMDWLEDSWTCWCPTCGTVVEPSGNCLVPQIASMADEFIRQEVGKVLGRADEK